MGRQGLTQSCNGSRATEDFSWVSINWGQKPIDSGLVIFFLFKHVGTWVVLLYPVSLQKERLTFLGR